MGAPLSIQQIKALICACVIVPDWGIIPESIAALIFDLFANTSAWVVKGPPEFELPAAWQLLLIAQTVVRMGCTSVENFGLIPAQEKVMVPPPPVPGVLLLHSANSKAVKIIMKMVEDVLSINESLYFLYT